MHALSALVARCPSRDAGVTEKSGSRSEALCAPARDRRLPGAERHRREPAQMAPRARHVVLRDLPAEAVPAAATSRSTRATSRSFNSYYNTVGPFHPRAQRHTLSRPTVDAGLRLPRPRRPAHVGARCDRLRARATARASTAPDARAESRAAASGAAAHGHQAQLLREPAVSRLQPNAPPRGADGAGRALARISRRHPRDRTWRRRRSASTTSSRGTRSSCATTASRRARSPTASILEFIERRAAMRGPSCGSPTAGARSRSARWNAPLYWIEHRRRMARDDALRACARSTPRKPVCHVSYYEADAYARWRGARLPTEAEWEAAAGAEPIEGNFVEIGPVPSARRGSGRTTAQWFGDVWEWTSSSLFALSGLPAARRRARRIQRQVHGQPIRAARRLLRDAARSHMRATYRNFFYPHDRWPFTGSARLDALRRARLRRASALFAA